jgi:two-component sensor histidine kinase
MIASEVQLFDALPMFDALPVAVYTTDTIGRITSYNQAALELAARRPKLGSDEYHITWRLDRSDGTPLPCDERPVAIALKEDRPVKGVDVMVERPDGTRVPLLLYSTPLHDRSGVLVGAANVLIDTSRRSDAEMRLQSMLLDELNHRTKNNMQILQSVLMIAARDAHSTEARAVLADASQRVTPMVAAQTMLYHAGNITKCGASEFLEMVCTGFQRAFGKNITVFYKPAFGLLPCDSVMPLALILNELLTNASKHGVNSRGEVSIKVGLVRESGSFVLSVEDDGPGFELEEVCERSSGLGLVLGLAKQLDGSLEVQRTPRGPLHGAISSTRSRRVRQRSRRIE